VRQRPDGDGGRLGVQLRADAAHLRLGDDGLDTQALARSSTLPAAGKLDQQQVQQVVLLELLLKLGVVAAGFGAHGRKQELVLDRDVGASAVAIAPRAWYWWAWLPSAAS
jgi:hypothetical protein